MRPLRRPARRTAAAAAVALLASAGFTVAAFADQISNQLGNSVDAVAEVMPLQAGGPNGTTRLFIQPTTGGGDQNGCNFDKGEKLVLDLHSSNPAVATVNPTVEFNGPGCGDEPMVTVTPLAEGSTTITATEKSNTTGGTFDLDPVTFIVNVVKPTPANTPPQVALTGVTPGGSYEIGSEPSPVCEVSDAEDGPSEFPATISGTLSHGLGELTATCSYTDIGGLGPAVATATYTIVDTGDPVIELVSRTPAANGHGWNNTDVTATWSCTDSGSGVKESTLTHTFSESGSHTATCEDWAGNTASATESARIDKDAPLVSLVGGPADGGAYYWGFVPGEPTCSASDLLSGLDGQCAVSGYSAAVGSHTVTASASDMAGNSASDSRAYTVEGWTPRGFYKPVDMGGVFNTVKGGSTVPLKFQLFAGPTELTDTAYVKPLISVKVACDGSAPTDEVEATATGGTSLRYDETAGQFVYNWQTPKKAGDCYRVTMTAQDGSALSALFKLK